MRFTKKKSEEFEKFLQERGYRKFIQHYKNEDFMYWKSFERNEEKDKGYSVGFSFYDLSNFPQYKLEECVSVQFEFLLGNRQGIDRLDVTISDDSMSLEEFESFCSEFYKFFKNTKYLK